MTDTFEVGKAYAAKSSGDKYRTVYVVREEVDPASPAARWGRFLRDQYVNGSPRGPHVYGFYPSDFPYYREVPHPDPEIRAAAERKRLIGALERELNPVIEVVAPGAEEPEHDDRYQPLADWEKELLSATPRKLPPSVGMLNSGDWAASDHIYPEEKAAQIVRNGERAAAYGHPSDDFYRSAKMWSGILGVDVTPRQVALCMGALKMSRLVGSPDHEDSLVDWVGYAICFDLIKERENDEQ